MFKRIWRRLFSAKRPFRLTRPGWIFILYTIGVGAGAINTGNNLLYLVFGVFLGILLASGVLSDLSLWGIKVEPTFPFSCEAGKIVSFYLKVTNTKKWLPSLSVQAIFDATLRGKAHIIRSHIPFVSAHSSETARVDWTPPERGWVAFEEARVATRYPFGLLEKWWHLAELKQGFYVTPTLVPLEISQVTVQSVGDEEPTETYERGDGSTLLGLRELSPTDNPRRIHWRASAKRAGTVSPWLIREMTKDQKEKVVFLCPTPAETSSLQENEIEKMVSFLASALLLFRKEGYEPEILVDDHVVINETTFLALWNPKAPADNELKNNLRPIPLVDRRSHQWAVRLVEATRAFAVR